MMSSLVYFGLLTVAPCLVSAQDQEALLELVSRECKRNREQLTSLDCEFRVTKSTAGSIEEAMAGNGEVISIRIGRWLVHNNVIYYELICKPDKNDKPAADCCQGLGGAPCPSVRILFDGLRTLRISSKLEVANLIHGKAKILMTPTSFGMTGKDESRFLDALLDDPGAEKELIARRNNQLDIRVRRTEEQGWLNHTVWTVDASRGYAPLQLVTMMMGQDQWETKTVVTNLKQVEPSVYFPMRSVTYSNPDVSKRITVFTIEVDRIAIGECHPEKHGFVLPKGCKIVMPFDMRSFVRVAQDVMVKPTDLSDWEGRCALALLRRIYGLVP